MAIPAFLLSEIVVRSYGVESVYSSNLAPKPVVDDWASLKTKNSLEPSSFISKPCNLKFVVFPALLPSKNSSLLMLIVSEWNLQVEIS